MEKANVEGDLITSAGTKMDVSALREAFIQSYSREKGWDAKNLTHEQLLEITSQKGYKTPGMILG